MTGANVAQHKVSNWTLYKDKGTDKASDILTFGEWNYNGMSSQQGDPHAFYAKANKQVIQDH